MKRLSGSLVYARGTLLLSLSPTRLVMPLVFLATMWPLLCAGQAPEPHEGKDPDAVARELANPNNSLASLTFKNQFRLYTGDLPEADQQSNYTLLFQPVFPFSLAPAPSGGKANLFVRPAIPLLFDQPVPTTSGFEGVTALGDVGFDVGYGVTEKSGFLWALGMVGTLPTATDSKVGGQQLRLGPEGLFAKFEKWGLYGIFPSHQWNVVGWGEDKSYRNTQIQALLKVLPGGGWTVGSTPIMNYDWQAKQWSIPLNAVVSRTVVIHKIPVKIEIEVNYYVKHADAFGPEWMFGLNITPVVPNFVDAWFRK